MSEKRGIVYLVGAGPGDPELITLRGYRTIRRADVVVHDRLVDRRLLRLARREAERISVGKRRGEHRMTQTAIQQLLIDRARRGLRVVRLKGGDPFVFGRGFEELAACRQAGVDCVVIPGVTSAVAAPGAAGVPVTLRGRSASFAVVTAERGSGLDSNGDVGFDASVFNGVDTLVILMGRAALSRIAGELIAAGRPVATPVACIERATLPDQRVAIGTLADIAAIVEREGLSAPMVTVVGDVAALAMERELRSISKTGSSSNAPGRLAGRRIVVTRPRSTGRELVDRLIEEGATPIVCAMSRIRYPKSNEPLDEAIRRIEDYRWIVFSSVHGVRGTWRRLWAMGFDARRLGGIGVAAIGPRTQRELLRHGIAADCVPESSDGGALVEAITAKRLPKGSRVLFPRGDIARTTIPDALRQAGAIVDAPMVYVNVEVHPSDDAIARVRRGADAVVFCSPSAARRFASLGVGGKRLSVVCLGPTTARAAREAGFQVDAVSRSCDNDGLIEALASCFEASVGA